MASADEQLPEGTDHIVEGAGVSDDSSSESPATASEPSPSDFGGGTGGSSGGDANDGEEPPISAIGADGAKGAFFDRIDALRGQANDRARELAQTGKDRATSALDSLVQTVEEAASEIDEKLGSQYGDYARRAAEHIGGFTDSFRDKDIDDLFNDARDFVKKSPAVAIGAAAALGFVVARLARSSMPESSGNDAPKA
jgi:ElaB/YqjD/DUF883 family membrane-anchored ribosome-binding protein